MSRVNVWDDFHFRWLKLWHYRDRDELNPHLKWRRSPSIHVWRYELSFNDFHFLFFTSSRRLQAPFSTFNSTSVSFLLFYTLQKIFNFFKIFEKSSGSSLLFVGRGGASWSGLQVCVLLYIFFLFLCELSKERSEAAVLHQLISIITSFWWR